MKIKTGKIPNNMTGGTTYTAELTTDNVNSFNLTVYDTLDLYKQLIDAIIKNIAEEYIKEHREKILENLARYNTSIVRTIIEKIVEEKL